MANTHRIAQPIELRNPYSNIDYNYGPYASKDAACAAIIKPQRLLGLTVAIEGDNGVEEYWFKEGVEDRDLVAKQRGGENTLYDTTTIYVDANPARKGGDGSMGNPFTNEEFFEYLLSLDIETSKLLIYLLNSGDSDDEAIRCSGLNKQLPDLFFINLDGVALSITNMYNYKLKCYLQDSCFSRINFYLHGSDELHCQNIAFDEFSGGGSGLLDEITEKQISPKLYMKNVNVVANTTEMRSFSITGFGDTYINGLNGFKSVGFEISEPDEECLIVIKNSHIEIQNEEYFEPTKNYHFINSIIEGISDENLLKCTLDDITYAALKSKLLVKEEKVNLNEKSELQLDWSIKNNKLYNVDLQGTNTSGFIINANGLKADSTYNETTLLITNATTTSRSVEIVGEEMKNAIPKFSLPPNKTAEVIIKAYGTWSSMTAITLGEWKMEIIA